MHKLTYSTTPPIRSTRLDYDEAKAILSALTASQAREARAVEALRRASKLREDYSRLATGDGDAEKVLFAVDAQVDAALTEFIDNGEDGG